MVSKTTLFRTILKNTDEDAHVMNDELSVYKSVGEHRKRGWS